MAMREGKGKKKEMDGGRDRAPGIARICKICAKGLVFNEYQQVESEARACVPTVG